MIFRQPEWPCPLDDSSEAALFSGLLQEEGIPHKVVRHGDSLWGFSEELSIGWGHVETTQEFQERLEALYAEFRAADSPPAEDVDQEL
ncbi:MAG: hypothetical protein WCG80_01515 [Spirochaetales bacterium]